MLTHIFALTGFLVFYLRNGGKGTEMADLDLRKLSAPVEALRPKMDAAYKLLDEQWKAIAAQLSELPIPCPVTYFYWHDEDDPSSYAGIAWKKINGSRRICSITDNEETDRNGEPFCSEAVTPYEEWSAEFRLEMLKHVPGLFKAAAKQTEEFIDRIHGKGGAK